MSTPKLEMGKVAVGLAKMLGLKGVEKLKPENYPPKVKKKIKQLETKHLRGQFDPDLIGATMHEELILVIALLKIQSEERIRPLLDKDLNELQGQFRLNLASEERTKNNLRSLLQERKKLEAVLLQCELAKKAAIAVITKEAAKGLQNASYIRAAGMGQRLIKKESEGNIRALKRIIKRFDKLITVLRDTLKTHNQYKAVQWLEKHIKVNNDGTVQIFGITATPVESRR